jgi:hypothetical protein
MNKKMIAGFLAILMMSGVSLPAFAAELKVADVDALVAKLKELGVA